MIFNKFNKIDGVSVSAVESIVNSNNNTTTIINAGSGSGERVLWGQLDDGRDLNSSMKVEGNIYVQSVSQQIPSYDDWENDKPDNIVSKDDTDYDDSWDDGNGSGNLTVDNNILCKKITTDTVMFDYPETNPHKTNLLNVLGEHDALLTQINGDIDEINTTIVNYGNNLDDINQQIGGYNSIINSLADKVKTCNTNSTNALNKSQQNSSRIDVLENKIDNIGTGGNGNGITTIDPNVNWKDYTVNTNTFSGIVYKSDEGCLDLSMTSFYDILDLEEQQQVQAPIIPQSETLDLYWESTEELGLSWVGKTKTISLGYYEVGQTIYVNTINARIVDWTDKNYTPTISRVGYSLFCNGQAIAGADGQVSFNWTVKKEGEYTMYTHVVGKHDKPMIELTDKDKTTVKLSYRYQLNNYYNRGLITPTGMGYSFDINEGGLFGVANNGFIVKYGGYGLKITADGIFKYNSIDDSWVQILN